MILNAGFTVGHWDLWGFFFHIMIYGGLEDLAGSSGYVKALGKKCGMILTVQRLNVEKGKYRNVTAIATL